MIILLRKAIIRDAIKQSHEMAPDIFEKYQKRLITTGASLVKGHIATEVWFVTEETADRIGYILKIKFTDYEDVLATSPCSYTPWADAMDVADGDAATIIEKSIINKRLGTNLEIK